MELKWRGNLAMLMALAAWQLTALATASAADSAVVPLQNGPNEIDFTGDGNADLVVLATRDNYNAHGFDTVAFYAHAAIDKDDTSPWKVVPLFDGDKEKDQVSVSGGADCLLHDFRLLAAKGGKPATLIIAEREFGVSYADPAPVNFTFYELKQNKEGLVGRPLFWFDKVRTQQAAKPWCDVGEAFDKELGLQPYRKQ
ncbi:MAG TPA: hypothetical protein VMH83_01935 [Candidatus Acidoferrum sp.]|nr:hypothetical protein [Candidatus Acidoferrum sp.]